MKKWLIDKYQSKFQSLKVKFTPEKMEGLPAVIAVTTNEVLAASFAILSAIFSGGLPLCRATYNMTTRQREANLSCLSNPQHSGLDFDFKVLVCVFSMAVFLKVVERIEDKLPIEKKNLTNCSRENFIYLLLSVSSISGLLVAGIDIFATIVVEKIATEPVTHLSFLLSIAFTLMASFLLFQIGKVVIKNLKPIFFIGLALTSIISVYYFYGKYQTWKKHQRNYAHSLRSDPSEIF